MKPMRRGFVTGADMPYDEALPRAAELDLEFVELAMEGANERERLAGEANEVAMLAEIHGLGLVAGLPLRVDVASPYEHVRDGSLLEVEAALDVAANVGASRAVLQASTWAFRPAYDDDRLRNYLLASVRTLDEYADERGIDLCVVVPAGEFFTVRRDLPRLFEETDASACLDTGQAYVGGLDATDQATLLMERGDRIPHVHLGDARTGADVVPPQGDDGGLPLGAGAIDFERLLDPVGEEWSGTLSLEVWTDDYGYVAESVRRLDAIL